MRRTRGAGRAAWVVLLAAGLAGPGPAAAQSSLLEEHTDEIALLRDAAMRESAGDLTGAEQRLRAILEARPASVPALLSLERVLRVQGRVDELVPLVRTALESDPRSVLLNQLLVRTLSALDRVDALEAAGAAWIAAEPRLETPYREVARVWEARGDHTRALAVLREGRDRLDAPDALALELGDLHATLDDAPRAVTEWERAIGPDGRGFTQVRRRLRALPDGGRGVVPGLVEALATSPTTPGRLRAALELAVEGRLTARARSIAGGLLPDLDLEHREQLLTRVARRADAVRATALSFWAYTQLLAVEEQLQWVHERAGGATTAAAPGSPAAARSRVIRDRLAELALEAGDTARAARDYQALASTYDQGSPERRRAEALRIELLSRQDPDAAMEALRSFRSANPVAPELDSLTAAVATALLDADRGEEAARVLAGARGPQSSLLKGRMALERGEASAARTAYMAAVPGLRGADATRALSMITLLGRVSDGSGAVLAGVLALRERGEPGAALDRLSRALPGLDPTDAPPLLEFAAALADDAGLPDDARALRRRLVADHPRSTEAPAALLALARSLAADPDGVAEARELLERLILEYPRSALAPQARRALEQLGRPEPGSGAAAAGASPDPQDPNQPGGAS